MAAEMGIERCDDGQMKVKIGDGIHTWGDLPYFAGGESGQQVVEGTAAPGESDVDYSLGTMWVNTTDNTLYLLASKADGAAQWKQALFASDIPNLSALTRIDGALVDKLEALPAIKQIGANLSLSEEGVLSATGTGTGTTTLDAIRLGGESGALASINSAKEAIIPLATGTLAGLVKSSDEDGKIAVNEDGTMSVNSISVSNLYVGAEDTLTLVGGDATA